MGTENSSFLACYILPDKTAPVFYHFKQRGNTYQLVIDAFHVVGGTAPLIRPSFLTLANLTSLKMASFKPYSMILPKLSAIYLYLQWVGYG